MGMVEEQRFVPGIVDLHLSNNLLVTIEIDHWVLDRDGHPIYIEDHLGVRYNWSNVLSYRVVQNKPKPTRWSQM